MKLITVLITLLAIKINRIEMNEKKNGWLHRSKSQKRALCDQREETEKMWTYKHSKKERDRHGAMTG